MLNELKKVDLKTLPTAPIKIQMAMLGILFVLLILLGYFLVISDQNQTLNDAKAQELSLKDTIQSKQRQVQNLNQLREELKTTEQAFSTLLHQLPTKAQMDTVLSEINQAGGGRGLQFDLFKPGQEIKQTEMAELPIEIKITGKYHDIAGFVSDIAHLPRIITIGNIQLSPVNDNSGLLSLQLIAKTYRVLDPEEKQANAAAKGEEKS